MLKTFLQYILPSIISTLGFILGYLYASKVAKRDRIECAKRDFRNHLLEIKINILNSSEKETINILNNSYINTYKTASSLRPYICFLKIKCFDNAWIEYKQTDNDIPFFYRHNIETINNETQKGISLTSSECLQRQDIIERIDNLLKFTKPK